MMYYGIYYDGWVNNSEYLERWYKARGYEIVEYNKKKYIEKKLR